MSGKTRTLITTPTALRRAGYKALLQGDLFDVVGMTASVREARRMTGTAAPHLLLTECPSPETTEFTDLKLFKAACPEMRVIVFVDGIAMPVAHELCRTGIEGLLETDIAPEALMGYINLVLLGEKIIHPSVGLAALRSATDPRDKRGLRKMSNRELLVIQHIANGLSNKEIGRSIGIADGTVKIHLRNVQRKLKMRNRTQVAVWAVANGLQDIKLPVGSPRELSRLARSQPETSQSETSQPKTSQPETSQPKTSQPKTSQPKTSQPETSQPKTSQPKTSQPKTSQPETSQPETSQPETSQSETPQPAQPPEPNLPAVFATRSRARSRGSRSGMDSEPASPVVP